MGLFVHFKYSVGQTGLLEAHTYHTFIVLHTSLSRVVLKQQPVCHGYVVGEPKSLGKRALYWPT